MIHAAHCPALTIFASAILSSLLVSSSLQALPPDAALDYETLTTGLGTGILCEPSLIQVQCRTPITGSIFLDDLGFLMRH